MSRDCPACAIFSKNILPELKKALVKYKAIVLKTIEFQRRGMITGIDDPTVPDQIGKIITHFPFLLLVHHDHWLAALKHSNFIPRSSVFTPMSDLNKLLKWIQTESSLPPLPIIIPPPKIVPPSPSPPITSSVPIPSTVSPSSLSPSLSSSSSSSLSSSLSPSSSSSSDISHHEKETSTPNNSMSHNTSSSKSFSISDHPIVSMKYDKKNSYSMSWYE